MDTALVSCILPVHNGAAHLAEAIESILRQRGVRIEVLAVDDGSTDASSAILARYAPAVRVLRQANAGPAASRNAGILASRGQFLAFLDQDDRWLPGKLERQVARLGARPDLDAVVSYVESFWDDDAGRERDQPRSGAVPGYVSGTLLARRAIFDRVGLFDPQLWFVDSLDWFARASECGASIELMPDVLAQHRVHRGNLSRRGRDSRAETLRVLRRALDRRRPAPTAWE